MIEQSIDIKALKFTENLAGGVCQKTFICSCILF